MTASRIGKPGVAVFVSLAVPLELFAGGAQPHIENEVWQPGYYNLTVPPVMISSRHQFLFARDRDTISHPVRRQFSGRTAMPDSVPRCAAVIRSVGNAESRLGLGDSSQQKWFTSSASMRAKQDS